MNLPKGYARHIYGNYGWSNYEYDKRIYRVPYENNLDFIIIDGPTYHFHAVKVKDLKEHPQCIEIDEVDRSYGES